MCTTEGHGVFGERRICALMKTSMLVCEGLTALSVMGNMTLPLGVDGL